MSSEPTNLTEALELAQNMSFDDADSLVRKFGGYLEETDIPTMWLVRTIIGGFEFDTIHRGPVLTQDEAPTLTVDSYGRIEGNMVNSIEDERTVNNVVRHAYRVLNDDEKEQVLDIKDTGAAFIALVQSMGSSRELSLSITKIEEAVFWAVKSITA